MRRVLAGGVVALAVATTPAVARADESTHGPIYVQGSVGVSFWDFPSITLFGPLSTSYSWTGFNPVIEVGFHFSGRHDGLMLGLRQGFSVTAMQGHAAGTTSVRGGYDFAFKAGALEVNVDPFATLGAGYVFDGPHAGLTGTVGLDAKLFVTQGLYVFARPAELGFQCLHDGGICAFVYAAGAGAGYAFGD